MHKLERAEAFAQISKLLEKAPHLIKGYKKALAAVTSKEHKKIEKRIDKLRQTLKRLQAASLDDIRPEFFYDLYKLYDESHQLIALLPESKRSSCSAILDAQTYHELEQALLPKAPSLEPDLVHTVGEYLSDASVASYGSTSLFHEEYSGKKQRITHKLLLAVAYGMESSYANYSMTAADTAGLFKHDLYAEDILTTSPEYLLERGNLTDWAGRKFTNITAFQYAVWAKDFKMVEMMLKHATPAIKAELLNQYEQVINEGLTYEITYERPILDEKGVPIRAIGPDNWETETVTEVHTEQHFDLNPLISVLKDYDAKHDSRTCPERDAIWTKIVGTFQRLLPIHLLQRYCDRDQTAHFYPKPAFENLAFKRTLRFFDYIRKAGNSILTSPLFSFDFALTCGPLGAEGVASERVSWSQEEAEALLHLEEVSTQKMQEIENELRLAVNTPARPGSNGTKP